MDELNITTTENNIDYRLHVRVIRESREGKTSGLTDRLVECVRGTLPIGGVVNYPSNIGQFWLVQTGGNVFEGYIGYDQPWIFCEEDEDPEMDLD